MKPAALALTFAALLATAASALTPPAKAARHKAAKTTTVCGTVRVDHVQCIRAPCPPLVFLTPDGGKKQYSISYDPSMDKTSAALHHGARVCVTGHVAGSRMDSLTVVKASKK